MLTGIMIGSALFFGDSDTSLGLTSFDGHFHRGTTAIRTLDDVVEGNGHD
jgi:hypothetical protein